VAARHGEPVVEDAAPSLGSAIHGQRVGSLSDFTCFSFHPRKSITTGEGGMITTNNADAADHLRRLRSHAASTSDLWRHQSGSTDLEEYRELGYNCRMTDIQAAIGVVQMSRLEVILNERRRMAKRYTERLSNNTRLLPPFEPPNYRHTYQSYCVRLRDDAARGTRARIMAELASQGIATRRGVMAAHLEPYYRTLTRTAQLPVTEQATAETMLLPLYAGMTDAEQDHVLAALGRSLR
jgi:dTDP-4-amino-4,6-dideoxygalactose transaminase